MGAQEPDPVPAGEPVLLADGTRALVRAASARDEAALRELHSRASDRSLYLRFAGAGRGMADRYVTALLDPSSDAAAYVAEVGGAVVGMAAVAPLPEPRTAEFALLVDDDHQHAGIGTLLLEHAAQSALRGGIRAFRAEVLASNRTMLRVLGDSGFTVSSETGSGVVSARFPLRPTEPSLAAMDERRRRAEVRSLAPLLHPRSVVVVGAGHRPDSVGRRVVANLRRGGFPGPVAAVNRGGVPAGEVTGYPTVADVPFVADLAVLAVPAAAATDAVAACGRAGVRAAVVLASGFAEAGPAGAERQRALLTAAQRSGMRLVGPNCLGVASPDPDVRLDALFSPARLQPGTLALASQSGAVGIAVLEGLARRGAGVSAFVSLGNAADVAADDLLLFWEQDERTRAVALYLESLPRPRTFLRVARRVSRSTPVLAVTTGRTAGGRRAGRSHTASQAAGHDLTGELLGQAGIVAVDSLADLLDTAQVLDAGRIRPAGRLGVVGNAGGTAVLAADAAAPAGLVLPTLPAEVTAALRRAVPAAAGVENPVDLGAGATPADLAAALAMVLPRVDVLLATMVGALDTDPAAVLTVLEEAARRFPDVVVLANLVGYRDPTDLPGVPCFALPEPAVRAAGRAVAWSRWRGCPPGEVPEPPELADARLDALLEPLRPATGDRWLGPEQTAALLRGCGVPVAQQRVVHDAGQASAAAAAVGLPVVVKTAVPEVVHKRERGGVRLGLATQEQVREGYEQVAAALADPRVLVQQTCGPGVELAVGVVRDDQLGPLLMLGLGGVALEALRDRAFRILPLSDVDADDLIRSLRASPWLLGHRGSAPVDLAALRDLLLRVAVLADRRAEVAEIDLNPVIASPDGVVVVDAKVRLESAPG